MSNYDKLKFEMHNIGGEQHGNFVWGSSRNDIFDRFYSAQELSDANDALLEFEGIIEDDTEFIDAYCSIGFLELDYYNNGNALDFFSSGYKIGSQLIPNNFKGKIIWGMMENRPFLRTMQGLGLTYLFIREWDKASKIFEKILAYNPNDNQGIRALIIQSYIASGKFENILKITKLFPDDILPDTLYGSVLANYRLDNMQKAEKALKEAIQYSPNVAKELIKKRHKKVASIIPGSVSAGGEDEAYDYWERVGPFWTDPKILNFLKDGLKKVGK